MEKATAIVDYAYPCMQAEKALKEAHNAMLKRSYNEAAEAALVAIAETKLMLNAIKHEQESTCQSLGHTAV